MKFYHQYLWFHYQLNLRNDNVDHLHKLVRINVHFVFYNHKFKFLLIFPEILFNLTQISNHDQYIYYQVYPIILNQIFQFFH